ncbi:YicC/YloC family endoribonuclease [Pelosinus propionicus]|uniref:TIGR00255 family protein n=1 Tax=Pelosinus propionicus DSM 13327 TaxID=1123291 RepID=A0A1I4L867_9FIRM|nr:YicC/YloC family endoribonuclease [Pelosinus propionicus]SFL87150.1 TIGR00255 family protein [Pelosinus propionicus DSM 13327]
MIKSMTGFGRGEFQDSEHRLIVEIKAVNHRYNEIVIRMPKNLGPLEDKIRRSVSSMLVRGRIDVFITMDEYAQKKKAVRIDKELAIAYNNALKDLGDLFSISVNDNVLQIAKFPDVVKVEEVTEDVLALWPKLHQAVDMALMNLMSMRLAEGRNIQQDLTLRITDIESYITAVEKRAPQVLVEYKEKILGRMRELLATIGEEPDAGRLLQEAAIFADRTSITEELVRLKSHLTQFRAALSADDAVGRKLDFIVQEINRETNTIASKANDFNVANIVVEIKSEIEKVREQIQNIE